MIEFMKITASNFMSIGNSPITLDYTSGLTYVYGINHDVNEDNEMTNISNGSGKTVCLVDALLFVLFGRTQRNIKKAQIPNVQNGGHCAVKVWLRKDGISYEIERCLNPDKLTIYKDGVEQNEEAKKRDSNKIIVEEILEGVSFEVFKNLIVLNGSSSKHFFEYGKAEKRVFINEVFRLGFLDYLQDQLKNEVKEMKNDVERNKTLLEAKIEECQKLERIIEDSEKFDPDKEKAELKEKHTEQLKVVNELNQKIKAMEEYMVANAYNEETIKSANESIQKANNAVTDINLSVNSNKQTLQRLRNEYESIMKQSVCKLCTQEIPDTLKKEVSQRITIEGKDAKTKIEELDSKKDKWESKLVGMKDWLEKAKGAIQSHKNAENKFEVEMANLEKYKKDPTSNAVNVESVKKAHEDTVKEKEELEEKYNQSQSDYNLHKYCRELVSDKNFYGTYISVFRKYLNTTINKYLEEMLSAHRIKFNNDLDADVFDGEGKSYNYNNLSTGERAKINLALLLSFFDVLNQFHRMKTNILVLDEVLDNGIDTEGVKALNNILMKKVQGEENAHLGIYVVSHKNSESDYTKQEGIGKLVFEKRLGFTSLKEGE